MLQTVMILAITAVVTMVTTIVTVRFTMTGRVLSQSANDKLKASGKRYGRIVFSMCNLFLDAGLLIFMIQSTGPITKPVVVLLC